MDKFVDSRLIMVAGVVLALLVSACAPLAIGAGAGAGYKVAGDERTMGGQLDDVTISSRVKLALIGEREVPARRIDVDVVQGVVRLGGLVGSVSIKCRAGELAGAVAGVKGVRNNIEVGSRSWGEVVDDRRIGARVKGALLKDEEIRGLAVDVDVYLKTVYLGGVVGSAALRERVEKLARRTDGVVRVVNQLVVE